MTVYAPTYYKNKNVYDPSTVTVIGDVVIENGVASNFSNSAYIKANVDNFTITSTDSFEIRIDFTHEEISSQNNFFTVGNGDNEAYYNGIAVTNTKNKQVYVEYHYQKEGSTTKYSAYANVSNLVVGKKYYLILTYDGDKNYKSELYDADTNQHLYSAYKNLADNETPLDINSEGNVVFGFGLYDNPSFGTVYPFPGKIDLNNCYIKINDEYIWKSFNEELIPSTADDYDVVENVKIKDIFVGQQRIKQVYNGNTLVYQALDDWEIPYRLEGCSYSGSGWNNNGDIPILFDKNNDSRNGSGGRNGYYGTSTITINLPYYIYLERGVVVNGVADRNGVGLINNFQMWTDSGKGTPLTNYESIARSNYAQKEFNSINTKVKTNKIFIEFWGDGWKALNEIYLYGKKII